jgi:hypothetical protein
VYHQTHRCSHPPRRRRASASPHIVRAWLRLALCSARAAASAAGHAHCSCVQAQCQPPAASRAAGAVAQRQRAHRSPSRFAPHAPPIPFHQTPW